MATIEQLLHDKTSFKVQQIDLFFAQKFIHCVNFAKETSAYNKPGIRFFTPPFGGSQRENAS